MTESEPDPVPIGVGLLDIVLAAVQSWKIMIVVGLLFGVAAWGLTNALMPPSFEAVAEVRLSEDELSLVLDNTLVESPNEDLLKPAADAQAAAAVIGADSDGRFFTKQSDTCFTISSIVTCNNLLGVRASTPERAEALLNRALTQLGTHYSSGGAAAQVAQREVDIYEKSLVGLRRVISQLQASLDPDSPSPGSFTVADYVSGIVALQRSINETEQAAFPVRQRLSIYREGIISKKPGQAARIGIRPEFVGLVAAIVSMLVVLNVALARLLLLRQDPGSNTRIKLRQVRAALNWSKSE